MLSSMNEAKQNRFNNILNSSLNYSLFSCAGRCSGHWCCYALELRHYSINVYLPCSSFPGNSFLLHYYWRGHSEITMICILHSWRRVLFPNLSYSLFSCTYRCSGHGCLYVLELWNHSINRHLPYSSFILHHSWRGHSEVPNNTQQFTKPFLEELYFFQTWSSRHPLSCTCTMLKCCLPWTKQSTHVWQRKFKLEPLPYSPVHVCRRSSHGCCDVP